MTYVQIGVVLQQPCSIAASNVRFRCVLCTARPDVSSAHAVNIDKRHLCKCLGKNGLSLLVVHHEPAASKMFATSRKHRCR